MTNSFRPISLLLCSGLLVAISACVDRRITTSVQDQAFVPAPPPAPPVAKVEPAQPPIQEERVPEPPSPPIAKAPEPPPPSEPAPPIAAAPRPEPPAAPVPEAKLEQPPAAAPAPVPEAKLEQPPAAVPVPAPAPAPLLAALTDVFFDFDRYTLRSDGQAALEADFKMIQGMGGRKLVIEGHCDERGTAEYNLVLGERRAHAVERYLENLGVSASEIQIVSYGKERPFCTDHNNDCWQKNRRAHLVLQ